MKKAVFTSLLICACALTAFPEEDLKATFSSSEKKATETTGPADEPPPKKDDYIQLIKMVRPPHQREHRDFYQRWNKLKTHYQKTLPSIFENDSWPIFIAEKVEDELDAEEAARAKVREKTEQQRQKAIAAAKKYRRPAGGGLGSSNRDPRSVTHDGYVGSAHPTVPLRSNALGSAYQWKNGKWTFTGKGWEKKNGKWVKKEGSALSR